MNREKYGALYRAIARACVIALAMFAFSWLPACSQDTPEGSASGVYVATTSGTDRQGARDGFTQDEHAQNEEGATDAAGVSRGASEMLELADIPEYTGNPYVVINDNEPTFSDDEVGAAETSEEPIEEYADLDDLNRCGTAEAVVSPDTMPDEERESIGMVKPSGWHTVRYDDLVDGRYLYNRCHLIGFQLTGENANEQNLITGTRYLNVEGMLPFENDVANYVDETGGSVLYRVTPVFEGDELVARGVQIEAESVEDVGERISFNVFCYNVQPGIAIDYQTGDSWRADDASAELTVESAAWQGLDADVVANGSASGVSAQRSDAYDKDGVPDAEDEINAEDEDTSTYVVNTNTGVFHYPDCPSVRKMKSTHRRRVEAARSNLIDQGYRPCGNCNP